MDMLKAGGGGVQKITVTRTGQVISVPQLLARRED
jgi:hypothetical protein